MAIMLYEAGLLVVDDQITEKSHKLSDIRELLLMRSFAELNSQRSMISLTGQPDASTTR